MIKVVKINNECVTPIPREADTDRRPILGCDLFPELYCNVFISAKKKSGKTSVVNKIIQKCVGRKTQVLAFCSTIDKDDNWIHIRKWLKMKGIEFKGYTSMKEDGVDLLAELVNDLEEQAHRENEEDEEEKDEQQRKQGGFQKAFWTKIEEENRENLKRERKPKYRAPDYMIILDDLSSELKSATLTALLKKNRHHKMKIVISSQYFLDMKPESRQQIDYYILFAGQTENKLEAVYKDGDLSIPYEKFHSLYEYATAEKYHFLYIDAREETYRRDFDKALTLDE